MKKNNISNLKKWLKKITKKNKNNKGFTLVELLATIALLSLVSTIVVYVALSVIGDAKEESYKVTVNNVEKDANNYILEDISQKKWVNIGSNSQYQCVSVQDLIDTGYFKSDVLDSLVDEGENLQADNCVYVERDKTTKTILKNVLLVGSKLNSYASLCGSSCENVISVNGNIDFTVEPTGWSKKKEVTILYDVYNTEDNVSSFKYYYEYDDGQNGISNFKNPTAVKKVEVTTNGTMYAEILDADGRELVSNSLLVSGIDNVNPRASITSTNNAASKQTVTLKMSDNAGVVAYYFGKSNPNTTTVTYEHIDSTTSYTTIREVDNSGTWYLAVEDVVGNKTVVSKTFYKTTLVVENGSVDPDVILTMSGYTAAIPEVEVDAYYSFVAWYTTSTFTGTPITSYKPTSNKTLYGKVVENVLTGGAVSIGGKVMYGETLTATITHTTPQADRYTYQWYYNSSKSSSNGTKITGATSRTYTIGEGLVGKYIYVVVTATKTNYRGTSFRNITSAVAKRPIVVTAGSTSKEYDGYAMIYSTCTATNMLSGHTVKCIMTDDSKITNPGVVDNVISSATVHNGEYATAYATGGGNDITENYSLTYKDGELLVTKGDTCEKSYQTVTLKNDLVAAGWTCTVTSSTYGGSTLYNCENPSCSSATITFKANGGYGPNAEKSGHGKYCTVTEENFDISGSMDPQTCESGEACTLRTNAYTRQCHEFLGWSTSATATEAEYTDGYVFTDGITGNMTLYAVWKSTHSWWRRGNTLFRAWNSAFTCCYKHTYAYAEYCTYCHMSRSHYRTCYKNTSSTMFCPGQSTYTLNDSYLVSGKSPTLNVTVTIDGVTTTLPVYDNEPMKYRGGTAEGFSKMSSGTITYSNPILVYEHTPEKWHNKYDNDNCLALEH